MRKHAALAWMLLLPTLVPLAVFVIYPAVRSLYLSFHDVEAFTGHEFFVGLDNYVSLFTSTDYWMSVRISFLFMLYTVVPAIVLSLAIAVALDANPFVRGLFRTVFLLPVSISSAMAAMLWIFIYNPTAGYLNFALDHFLGVPGPNWLGDHRWALIAVALTTVWKEIGFSVIFFLAGLSSVPPELKEAAIVDGANAWQRFRHVTLPILSPTIFFVAVVSFINSFQSFGQIHILTGGGPAGETSTLVYRLYLDGFVNFRTGYASAQAILLFAIMLAATAFQFRMAKRRVHYG